MSIYTHDNSIPSGNISEPSQPKTTPNATLNNNVRPKDINSPVPGWPMLANAIALSPGLEAFSSFTNLNIKSLLYYQAELDYLRKKLHKAEWNDFLSSTDSIESRYAEDLDYLFSTAEDENSKDPEQWTILCKIRAVLEKYSKSNLHW
ncbi:hypothetical protein DL98DRAFT_521292 [Cadophora sp. DSE1049]|nr:hypothetical protein DL98DRAFT_521292 [Cadophora sp. DSE1049]